MRNKLIAVYGGTELDENAQELVHCLTQSLLERPDVVLITGGFDYSERSRQAKSTDRTVLEAAREFTVTSGKPLRDRFQTWIPEPAKDRRDVVRFREGKVRVVTGKSAQARRLTMVEEVDAVVTVAGKKHTALVLDMAYTIGKPALTLPSTGGDSRDYWDENREEIAKTFRLSIDLQRRLESAATASKDELRQLASQLSEHIWSASVHTCLVFSRFTEEVDLFQSKFLNPVIEEEGFRVIRIDRTPDSGNIAAIFLDRLAIADAVIADVTEESPNVMYELGQAHARHLKPLLFSRRPLTGLPFYLRQDKLVSGDASTELGTADLTLAIRKFLRGVQKPVREE